MSTEAKPVRLQFNQTGAWRNAIGFDAGNQTKSIEILQHAAALALLTGATARVVVDDGSQMAIARWNETDGWHDAVTRKPITW